MDKFEYKVRAEEIKSLIAQKDYAQAAEIADTIDWRRVKSVMMLCTISDLYKINRRYEDAMDMLMLAYDRHPGGRTIVYSLCELAIKTEEFVRAVEYYKEFIQIAPKDTGRYILQYKLYVAQDVSLEERIAVLEELKKRDYREKWAYELAYLYHRVGLSTRCVEECDELILWFGDGKYVIKAMELKMLHQPLTPQQQQKYDYRFQPRYEEPAVSPKQEQPVENPQPEQPEHEEEQYDFVQYEQAVAEKEEPVQEKSAAVSQEAEEFDIHVKTMDVSQYNTINLQKELAEGLKEVLGEKDPMIADAATGNIPTPVYDNETESFDSIRIEELDEDALEPEVQGTEVYFGETEEFTEIEVELVPGIREELQEEIREEASVEFDDQVEGQLTFDDLLSDWEILKKEAAEEDIAEEFTEEPAEEPAEEPKASVVEESVPAEEEILSEEFAPAEEFAAVEEPAPVKESAPVREAAHARNLTKEEKELFGQFIQNRSFKQKLVTALDHISLAAHTGNVVITGDEGMDTMGFARSLIRDIQMTDSNFSGKTAKISGTALNQKDVAVILEQLNNGALIVQKVSDINENTVKALYRKMQQDSMGIIVVVEDTRRNMDKFLAQHGQLAECFTARIDMEALSNDMLVAFAKKYAREMEYSIDDLGVLALHTRIEELQTIDHSVTVAEVKDIVDEAIYLADRKTIKHFLDVLFGKRYDDEDMIILRENDFR